VRHQLATTNSRPPHLIHALEALAQRSEHQQAADVLLEELSGITVLVAKRFTNDRTADGILEAFYLTVGCVSLGISQATLPESDEAKLNFLLSHGAEHVFQMGFRHLKALSAMPYTTFVTDFDGDAYVQQRNLKALFSEICRANPSEAWSGDDTYRRQLQDRQYNQQVVDCAKWLRKNHFAGPVKDSDLDAHAVIAIAIIFAMLNDGRIVARTGQKEIESLIRRARETPPDVDAGWDALLLKSPPEYHYVLRVHMTQFHDTIIKKILSKTKAKTVLTEIQDCYASTEVDIDYS